MSNHAFQVQERGDRTAPRRSDRTYWLLSSLLTRLKFVLRSDLLPKGTKLLDYGCANKPYQSLFIKKFDQYIGADLTGNPLADIIIGEKGDLPCEPNSFDCVLSSQVLEHVIDPNVYLRESWRVLRANGSLILSTHGIWPYHPDPTDFWRWTIDGLQLEIRRAGFEILLVQSVFGMESVALQLWQDATHERLPRFIRSIYTGLFQFGIGLIERRQPNKLSTDAAVYVILARKIERGADAIVQTDAQR